MCDKPPGVDILFLSPPMGAGFKYLQEGLHLVGVYGFFRARLKARLSGKKLG
jgi:hypothetical protein